MVEAEALKKFINIPKYQEIVSVTPTRSRKRHEVLVEFNTPSAITQKKWEISLTHQQNDGKLETSILHEVFLDQKFGKPEILIHA